jgi:hypothetical protein
MGKSTFNLSRGIPADCNDEHPADKSINALSVLRTNIPDFLPCRRFGADTRTMNLPGLAAYRQGPANRRVRTVSPAPGA